MMRDELFRHQPSGFGKHALRWPKPEFVLVLAKGTDFKMYHYTVERRCGRFNKR